MASSTFSRTARTNLDLDTLRTLGVARDRGGLAQAAEHLGRTPSAISLQMKRLQEDLGTPIFRKRGRGLALTEAGEIALSYARRILTAAEKLLPDGKRVPDYGPNPHGLAIFTADGYYSVQIYRAERLKFSSGDKFKATLEEYKDASLSTSVHFGRYTVDPVKHTITFQIDRSSVPNLDDTTAVGQYEMKGDELSWRVGSAAGWLYPPHHITTGQVERTKEAQEQIVALC